MDIVEKAGVDAGVLALFSQHDDFMLDFLGDDRRFYTRYSEKENLERIWVACDGDQAAGCIAFRKKDAGVGEVKRLFIRPAYRGRGLSKALLKTLEQYAKARDCQKLYLDTRITLEPAVSLYRAVGFRVTFQQGLYIQMEKILTQAI